MIRPRTIAALIETRSTDNGPQDVIPHVNVNRVNLEGATLVEQSPDAGLELDGVLGIGEGTAISIHAGMNPDEVAEAMVQPWQIFSPAESRPPSSSPRI